MTSSFASLSSLVSRSSDYISILARKAHGMLFARTPRVKSYPGSIATSQHLQRFVTMVRHAGPAPLPRAMASSNGSAGWSLKRTCEEHELARYVVGIYMPSSFALSDFSSTLPPHLDQTGQRTGLCPSCPQAAECSASMRLLELVFLQATVARSTATQGSQF